MSEEKKVIVDGQELENVNGGYSDGSGYYMTVGSCSDGYLALNQLLAWDKSRELAQMLPGSQVFTYGTAQTGTGQNNVPCTNIYVYFNGIWGWANSAYLY